MNLRTFKILNTLAFVFAIVMNTLANLLPLGGMDTGELSALYPNLFVPAGFTFAIWGVIYLLLAGHLVWQWIADSDTVVSRIGPWLAINLIANGTWIAVWHGQMIYASIAVMLLILFSLIQIYRALDVRYAPIRFWYQVPISVYLGWISVATIANSTAVLVGSGVSDLALGQPAWASLMLGVAGLLALYFLWTRRDIWLAAVVVWAAYGIYSRRIADTAAQDGSVETIAMSVIIVVSLFLIVQVIGLVRRWSI